MRVADDEEWRELGVRLRRLRPDVYERLCGLGKLLDGLPELDKIDLLRAMREAVRGVKQ